MRNVNVRHEHAVVADDRAVLRTHRAVNGDVFANDISVANNRAAAFFFSETDALRKPADRRALEDMVIFTDDRAFFNRDARLENGAIPDRRALFYDAERTDLDVLSKLGRWIDQ